MYKLKQILKFYRDVYLKSNQFIIPFIVLIIFLYASYSIIPVSVVSSFSITMVMVFYLMVWVSFKFADTEENVLGQIITLKLRSESLYNWSRLIFVVIIGLIMSIIATMFPVIMNVTNGFRLYTRDITILDIIIALILHLITSFMGLMIGLFFHPRIIIDRKAAMVGVFFVSIMAYVKGPLVEDFPMCKLVTWIFPPLYNVLQLFTIDDYYHVKTVSLAIIYIVFYSLVLLLLHMIFLKRNRFL